jgi:hypothetical protein
LDNQFTRPSIIIGLKSSKVKRKKKKETNTIRQLLSWNTRVAQNFVLNLFLFINFFLLYFGANLKRYFCSSFVGARE